MTSTIAEMEQQAKAWLDAGAAPFEATYSGQLSPASPTSSSLYQHGAQTANSFGIRFSRPIQADDSIETLQRLLQFCTFEHVELPGLVVPAGWQVTGRFPLSRVEKEDADQVITVTGFNGVVLQWTVQNARFFAIGGVQLAALQEIKHCADKSLSEGTYWQVREEFLGNLHFECPVTLNV